jgi:hypothetical protein
MPEPTMTITIAPGPDGKAAMWVSWSNADGATAGPPRKVVLNSRLASFVFEMQAFAREKLAAHESLAQRRGPDGNPAIIADATDGK